MQKLLVLRLIFLYEPFIILESSYLKLIILKVTSHLSGLCAPPLEQVYFPDRLAGIDLWSV